MKIVAYIQMARIHDRPTGVGKHIINVLPRLAAANGVSLKVMTTAKPAFSPPPATPEILRPTIVLPAHRKALEIAWMTLGFPSTDRWAGNADWVYCPTEIPVPTRRSRLAVTCHGLWWLELGEPWSNTRSMRRNRIKWKWRMGTIRRHADLVFVVSEFLKNRVEALTGIKSEKIVVIGNGVEKSYFDIALCRRQEQRQPYLLMVGGLTALKGAAVVIETAKILESRKSSIQILVAGTGEKYFERQAQTLKNVQVLGYCGPDTLPQLVRNATALFFPSQYETFGIPAAEAMAAGTPAIVSNCAGLMEVVGEAGIVIDRLTGAADAADAAIELAENSGRREQLAEKGRVRASAYTWDECTRRMLAAFSRASG